MKVEFKKFSSAIASVLLTNNSAMMNLTRLEKGTKDTARTWFYEDLEPEAVIAPVVSALRDLETTRPEIASWDLSKIDKFQAQGRAAAFTDRIPNFEEYFQHLDPPPLLREKDWLEAKKEAVRLLKFNGRGKPLSIAEVVERGLAENKYDTSSGYPLFLKRKNPAALEEAKRDAEGNKAIKERFPFMVGSRAQMGKVGVDARFIFMAPMAVNVCGQRFAHPVQDYLTRVSERLLLKVIGGFTPAPTRMHDIESELISTWDDNNEDTMMLTFFTPWLGWDKVQLVISEYWDQVQMRFGADYTKMDQHFNKYHALEVYDVMKYFFAPEYRDELKECVLYPFTAPIITSSGMVDQDHALLSGSEFTNLVETIWNFIFLLYLKRKLGSKDFFLVPMGIGDDQLWLMIRTKTKWPGALDDPFQFCKFVVNQFEYAGLPGNDKKQEGVEDADSSGFLQRHMWSDWNGPDGDTPAAGVYSLIRNVTSQVFPERYHNDPRYDWKAFAIRVIMIAENCCKHPLFKWYVTEFIANANINILRFCLLTPRSINRKWDEVKNMAGFRPNYNQEKQEKPLTEFETFKLLREVAEKRRGDVEQTVLTEKARRQHAKKHQA